MNTLVCLLSVVIGQADDPNVRLWQPNYTQAQTMAAQDNKPMAVFLTQGQRDINMLIAGGLSEQARTLLTSNYVPVLIDTTTPQGQRLARAFEIRQGRGLVLSDRGGARQAFWYEGQLNNDALIRNLEKYANQTEVRMTEVAGRSSYYGSGDAQGSMSRRGMPASSDYASSGEQQRRRLLQGRLGRRSN